VKQQILWNKFYIRRAYFTPNCTWSPNYSVLVYSLLSLRIACCANLFHQKHINFPSFLFIFFLPSCRKSVNMVMWRTSLVFLCSFRQNSPAGYAPPSDSDNDELAPLEEVAQPEQQQQPPPQPEQEPLQSISMEEIFANFRSVQCSICSLFRKTRGTQTPLPPSDERQQQLPQQQQRV
jgi:hypothetical protein